MIEQIRPVSWATIQLIWVDDWYDWELSGAAMLDGKRIWFDCLEDYSHERVFGIYDLPAEVWQKLDERHRDFQLYVGTHWDFDAECGGCSIAGKVKPQDQHDKFYSKWKGWELELQPEWQIAISDTRKDA